MNILIVDCTTKDLIVAVVKEGVVTDGTVRNNGTHHLERLCSCVQETLDRAEITLSQLDCIACAVGPGSFTGIRIGISAVKGYVCALNIPVVEIDVLHAMQLGNDRGAVIDAGNGYYYAKYDGYQCVTAPCLISYDDERAKNAVTMEECNLLDGEVAIALHRVENNQFASKLTPVYIRKSQAEELKNAQGTR